MKFQSGPVSLVVACLSIGSVIAGHLSNREAESASPAKSSVPKAVQDEPDRSPIAVAVASGGQYCLVANHGADSVSLVDLKTGTVVAEHACGRGPIDVVWIDSETALVSLQNDDAVAVVHRRGERLTAGAVIRVGDGPRGIALEPKAAVGGDRSRRAFVAVSGCDEVVVVDLKKQAVTARIPAGGRPRALNVSPNGRWLVTCSSLPGELLVHDAQTFELISRRTLFDEPFNMGRPIVPADSSVCLFPSAINRAFAVTEGNIAKGWVLDNRLTRMPLPDGEYWEQKQIGLDVRDNAVGDAHAVALDPSETWVAVTCGGSHELLILRKDAMIWPGGDPGDFLPDEILYTEGAFRRLELGGRPTDIEFLDEKTAVIANYLQNSLQIVDVAEARLIRSIDLGGPAKPSLARRGEAIFYDADRSLHSWFSCHTCHTDGHTCGRTFDTINDGSYDSRKLTPSLRGVAKTPPWTWHGWQKSLENAMRTSLRETLATEQPITDEDVRALVAFLETLTPPPSPHRRSDGELTSQATRGKRLFEGKAGCITCHRGETFTSDATYKVGLESPRDVFPEGFNPPSLRGLHTRRRFLHDGRAESLHEVLLHYHRPENLAGEELTADELDDLIAYLKSL